MHNLIILFHSHKRGGDKAKTFEPLESIVDWLIANPDPDWNLQLREASLVRAEQGWRY